MFNNIGIPGLLLIAVVVLVLFGRGKVASLMGEVGKGINAFKKGVKEEDEEAEQRKVEEARDVSPPARGDAASPLPRERADEVLKDTPPRAPKTAAPAAGKTRT